MVRVITAAATILFMACSAAQIDAPSPRRVDAAAAVPATDLKWQDVPGSPGEQVVILAGDPAQPGEYTLRRRFPAGHSTLPHWHPHAEYGTVVSGVFYLGFGETASRSEAVRLGPGAFIRVPPFTPHFSYADEEVVLQVHGPGPRVTYFVHENPIPRRSDSP